MSKLFCRLYNYSWFQTVQHCSIGCRWPTALAAVQAAPLKVIAQWELGGKNILNEEMVRKAMAWNRRKWKKMWPKQQDLCFCRLVEEESDQNYIIWSEQWILITLDSVQNVHFQSSNLLTKHITVVIPMNDKCHWVHELVANGWTEAWLLDSYHALGTRTKPHSVSRIPTCCCCDVMLIRCVPLTSLVETCTLSQLPTYQSWSSLL
jgi:hypothetical protein